MIPLWVKGTIAVAAVVTALAGLWLVDTFTPGPAQRRAISHHAVPMETGPSTGLRTATVTEADAVRGFLARSNGELSDLPVYATADAAKQVRAAREERKRDGLRMSGSLRLQGRILVRPGSHGTSVAFVEIDPSDVRVQDAYGVRIPASTRPELHRFGLTVSDGVARVRAHRPDLRCLYRVCRADGSPTDRLNHADPRTHTDHPDDSDRSDRADRSALQDVTP